MKRHFTHWLAALVALAGSLPHFTSAAVPGIITYQGRVAANGTNFTGTGYFKFALVNGANAKTLWSNNGSSFNGSEPNASVALSVADGVFTASLGDTAFAGMTIAIPATVFANGDVRLRVWFSATGLGFSQFAPDQRLTSAGYALRAANVLDGSITSAQLAPGAVTGEQIGNGAVGPTELADGAVTTAKLAAMAVTGPKVTNRLELGSTSASGALHLINSLSDSVGIELNTGIGNELAVYSTDGQAGGRLEAHTFGRITLYDGPDDDLTVDLTANYDTGGLLRLNNADGLQRASLLAGGSHDGGELLLRDSAGATRLRLYGNAPGYVTDTPAAGGIDLFDLNGLRRISLRGADGTIHLPQPNGNEGVFLAGQTLGGGGVIGVRQVDGNSGVTLLGDSGGSGLISVHGLNGTSAITLDSVSPVGGAEVSLKNASGEETVEILGQDSGTSQGGQIVLRRSGGVATVEIDGQLGAEGGGFIQLHKGDGTPAITLDSQDGQDLGRITTEVLEITGGSDLSEKFDIALGHGPVVPGTVVCIDPLHPGRLVPCSKAYDRTVAGAVSGGGGVRPGLLMGQTGSAADGGYPVALTGRVYCLVDASHGAVKPGDLITTSDTPGHGMVVTRHERAQGAILGKAMSSLDNGRGLVLVLVNLQ